MEIPGGSAGAEPDGGLCVARMIKASHAESRYVMLLLATIALMFLQSMWQEAKDEWRDLVEPLHNVKDILRENAKKVQKRLNDD